MTTVLFFVENKCLFAMLLVLNMVKQLGYPARWADCLLNYFCDDVKASNKTIPLKHKNKNKQYSKLITGQLKILKLVKRLASFNNCFIFRIVYSIYFLKYTHIRNKQINLFSTEQGLLSICHVRVNGRQFLKCTNLIQLAIWMVPNDSD